MPKKTKTKKQLLKEKKEKKRKIGVYQKTALDGMVGGLLSVGIFFSGAIQTDSRPLETYQMLFIMFLMIGFVILIYSYNRKRKEIAYGFLLVLAVGFGEVILIGLIFNESWRNIMIAMFIVTPSILIFDKLLG